MVDGQPHQAIGSPEEFSLRFVDLSGLSPAERLPQSRRLATEEAGRPFDLAQGPLIRARLLRLDDQEHGVLLTMPTTTDANR